MAHFGNTFANFVHLNPHTGKIIEDITWDFSSIEAGTIQTSILKGNPAVNSGVIDVDDTMIFTAGEGVQFNNGELLDSYNTGTYTATFTASVSPNPTFTATVNWVQIGPQITLTIIPNTLPTVTGGDHFTSNLTLPAALIPHTDIFSLVPIKSNGLFSMGLLDVQAPLGTMLVYPLDENAVDKIDTEGTFPAGVGGLWNCTISWVKL